MKPILAALALIGVAASADAQYAGTKEEQRACRPDVRRFCSHIANPDNQKYRDCLQSHMPELSQKCQQVLMNHPNSQ